MTGDHPSKEIQSLNQIIKGEIHEGILLNQIQTFSYMDLSVEMLLAFNFSKHSGKI